MHGTGPLRESCAESCPHPIQPADVYSLDDGWFAAKLLMRAIIYLNLKVHFERKCVLKSFLKTSKAKLFLIELPNNA